MLVFLLAARDHNHTARLEAYLQIAILNAFFWISPGRALSRSIYPQFGSGPQNQKISSILGNKFSVDCMFRGCPARLFKHRRSKFQCVFVSGAGDFALAKQLLAHPTWPSFSGCRQESWIQPCLCAVVWRSGRQLFQDL